MTYNESNTELFDQYLKRRLSEADLLAFEVRLKSDTAFAEAFAFHQLMVEGVKDHARAELKQFLSESTAMPTKGRVVKFRNIQWAAAAAVVLILGVYGIIQLYVEPKKDQDIAVLDKVKTSPIQTSGDSGIAPAETHGTDTFMALIPREEALNEMATIEENALSEKDFSLEEDNKGLSEAVALDDAPNQVYPVLTEKKIKDSSITLYNIPLLASNYDNNTYKSKKALGSKLPQNANSAPATVNDKEEVAKSKKKSAPSGIKLQVEFWQSPVNFKGYKYWGNTIQLYGVDQNTASLYAINNNIYLRDKGNVYLLGINTDATPYKVESDEDIVQLILSQK